jgi:hypothetical protein
LSQMILLFFPDSLWTVQRTLPLNYTESVPIESLKGILWRSWTVSVIFVFVSRNHVSSSWSWSFKSPFPGVSPSNWHQWCLMMYWGNRCIHLRACSCFTHHFASNHPSRHHLNHWWLHDKILRICRFRFKLLSWMKICCVWDSVDTKTQSPESWVTLVCFARLDLMSLLSVYCCSSVVVLSLGFPLELLGDA